MTIYIDKRVKSSWWYNNPKNTCTKQQSPKIYEANLDKIDGRNNTSTVTAGDFNTPFSVIDGTSIQRSVRKYRIWTTL